MKKGAAVVQRPGFRIQTSMQENTPAKTDAFATVLSHVDQAGKELWVDTIGRKGLPFGQD